MINIDKLYYISDLHIENQLPIAGELYIVTRQMIAEKVDELVRSIPDTNYWLLIPGDIARHYMTVMSFYEALSARWEGKIIAVLGNHELSYAGQCRNIDQIYVFYLRNLVKQKTFLLENGLILFNKSKKPLFHPEEIINEMSLEELRKECKEAKFLVLGGTGYAGANSYWNAEKGIYGSMVSREEEIDRTARFVAVYKKLQLCASDCRAIVMTHMPPWDWMEKNYVDGWIYLCGHTHKNERTIKEGATIIMDNQMGRSPRIWGLKSIEMN